MHGLALSFFLALYVPFAIYDLVRCNRAQAKGSGARAIDLNRPPRENDRLMKAKPLRVGKVLIGGRDPVFILGPCVIESEKFVWRMAKRIAEICAAEDIDFIFKASYDKANRTSVRSFRGVGVREGCEILSVIGRDLKIPVTTDVHSPPKPKLPAKRSIWCKSRRFFAAKPISCAQLLKRVVRSM